MKNMKLILEYEGTRYHGWQSQTGGNTIQDILERALRSITGESVKVVGSGRTDAGVHARSQVAHFHTKSRLGPETFRRALNSLLPDDVAVVEASRVPDSFHARYGATSKEYWYTILQRNSRAPLIRWYAFHSRYILDTDLMRQAAGYLLGKHDFSSFESSGGGQRDPVKNMMKVDIENSSDLIVIKLEASGFLYRMVRNIVGTLIEVGRKKSRPGSVKRILERKSRIHAGPAAPAHGLCLMKVNY